MDMFLKLGKLNKTICMDTKHKEELNDQVRFSVCLFVCFFLFLNLG